MPLEVGIEIRWRGYPPENPKIKSTKIAIFAFFDNFGGPWGAHPGGLAKLCLMSFVGEPVPYKSPKNFGPAG